MVRIGDTVTRKPLTIGDYDEKMRKHTDKPMRGKVVYVHPLGRFHTVEFMTAGGPLRESFMGVGK